MSEVNCLKLYFTLMLNPFAIFYNFKNIYDIKMEHLTITVFNIISHN